MASPSPAMCQSAPTSSAPNTMPTIKIAPRLSSRRLWLGARVACFEVARNLDFGIAREVRRSRQNQLGGELDVLFAFAGEAVFGDIVVICRVVGQDDDGGPCGSGSCALQDQVSRAQFHQLPSRHEEEHDRHVGDDVFDEDRAALVTPQQYEQAFHPFLQRTSATSAVATNTAGPKRSSVSNACGTSLRRALGRNGFLSSTAEFPISRNSSPW